MRTENGYELSDFKVDISEEPGWVRIRLECFADNRVDIPFQLAVNSLIDSECTSDTKFFYSVLSRTISDMVNTITTTDIQRPDPCECQDHYWFKTHPDDRQEYWRSKSGRIFPKTHTLKCPHNPANRRKNDG